jgi:LysM repeat protein
MADLRENQARQVSVASIVKALNVGPNTSKKNFFSFMPRSICIPGMIRMCMDWNLKRDADPGRPLENIPRVRLPVVLFKSLALVLALFLFAGCDQIAQMRGPKPVDLGDQAFSAGDYPKAVRFYEAALDGTSETSDLHYKLAIIYDTHLKDPTSAIHHYRRHLRMTDSDLRKEETELSIDRLQREMATRLGEGGLVSRAEAVRLRNENNELRKQISQLRSEKSAAEARARSGSQAKPGAAQGASGQSPPVPRAEAVAGPETTTYTVQTGDTLASISRRFYQTTARWKDIADANHNQLDGSTNIREGMILIIP